MPPEYRADQIKVVTFDEAVRRRPAMYFGCAADDPAFPAAVLRRVVDDALTEPARVRVVIESDHRFTVVDDAVAEHWPPDGFPGTLLPRRRWALAAAAAVSTRTTVEVRAEGRSWSQTLVGLTPTAPAEEGAPADEPGTRITFELDTAFFVRGAILPRDALRDLEGVEVSCLRSGASEPPRTR